MHTSGNHDLPSWDAAGGGDPEEDPGIELEATIAHAVAKLRRLEAPAVFSLGGKQVGYALLPPGPSGWSTAPGILSRTVIAASSGETKGSCANEGWPTTSASSSRAASPSMAR